MAWKTGATAAGGLLTAAAAVTGFGWASADDAKPNPKPEAKAARPADGDKPKPAESDEVRRIKKAIDEAVANGDADKVHKLVGELERAMAPKPRGDGRRPDLLGDDAPPVFEGFDGPGFQGFVPGNEQAREAMRQMLERMRADFGPGGPSLVPLHREGRPAAGRFGVAIARLPDALADQLDLPKDAGLLVADVAPGSVAEKAGVRKHDILVKFAGKDVPADERQFIGAVGEAKGGQKVEVVVVRKGKKETLSADLPEPPKPARRADGERPDRGGKVAFQTMSSTVTDGKFDVKATKGDTTYTVSGTLDDGKPAIEKVTVKDGDDSKGYGSLADVPEQHRAAVRQMLGSVSGGR